VVGVGAVALTQGKSCYCAGGLNASIKGVFVVDNKAMMLAVESGDIATLKKLVNEELDRRCQAIDDIIVQGYGEYIGKRAEGNREAVKTVVLELVRSPLAILELKLEALEVKVEVKPKPEPEAKPEPGVEEEVKPEPEPA